MNTYKHTSYEDRLQRVTQYIYDHLDEDIDLLHLSEIACMSPYHWHRIYRSVYGETIAMTVRRLRLARAAAQLIRTEDTVKDIAVRAGYTNVQSFTRLFKNAYGLPPADYRKNGPHRRYTSQHDPKDTQMYDMRIEEIPAKTVTGLHHSGSYMNIGSTFDRLFGTIGNRDIDWSNNQLLALYFDDPNSIEEDDLRSFAAITTNNSIPVEAPLVETGVRGGKYAILRYRGPYAEMQQAYNWLYGTWLIASNEEAADAPCMEIYLNNPRDTPAAGLLTDIHLPLI